MSDKLTLTELASLQNQTSAINIINNNFDLIAEKLDTLLSRDGDTPNQMEASLDMNSFRITNLPAPINLTEPVRLSEIQELVSGGIPLGSLDGDRISVNSLSVDRIEGLIPGSKLSSGAAVFNLGFTPENIANKNANNGYVGLKAPTINAGVAGGRSNHGFVVGPSRFGSSSALPTDSFVLAYSDETWQNVDQEVRGITFTMRNLRTTADEAVYGWDFIPASFGVVIDQYNTQYIRGVQKPVVAESIYQSPVSGSYSVRATQGFGYTLAIGNNVDAERVVGLKIDTPLALESGFDSPVAAPETRIQIGYGIEINEQRGRVAKAAIKLNGSGTGSRIVWTNTHLTEDSSGKLEANLNFQPVSLVNCSVALSATAGSSGGLPAQVAGYERKIVNGTERRYPFYNA